MMKFMFMFLVLFFFKNNFWLIMNMLIILCLSYFVFIPLYYQSVSLNFLLDDLSFFMILLSLWIMSLMFLSSESISHFNNFKDHFSCVLMFLVLFLILSFAVNNMLLFYIFFESSLIPTFLLILGWGYQPERIQAGLYLIFYTLVASLPLLMGIFYLKSSNSSMNYFFLKEKESYLFLYFSLVVAFLVKMPMFLVHLWLPKAHVEAPISGSMILAAILLKLGGYGLMRLLICLMSMNKMLSSWWVSVSLYGGSLISLSCLRQTDLKSLIAYSSVAHMGLVLGGLFTLNFWGLVGCFIMMIAHGLCSSGLFCLANISYERIHSRSMFMNKGMISFMPSLTLWWFLLSASNMSSPPSLNLLGEIDLINSLVGWSYLTMILIFMLSFFSAAYCFYLFSYSQHGNSFSGTYSFTNMTIREFALLSLHWIPLNLLFLNGQLFMI